MGLIQALQLDPAQDRVISIVGSGGKTTLLYALARAYAKAGLSVGVITTTHIFCPQEPDFSIVTDQLPVLVQGGITVCGTPAKDGKLAAPAADLLDHLLRAADVVLAEADGSRRLPLKLPNQSEPVILPQSDRVIAVAGLGALGKPLGEVCHRIELVQKQLGLSPLQTVTPEIIAALLLHGYGAIGGLTVLLNQADTPMLAAQGKCVASLLQEGGIAQILITSLKQEAEQC